MFVNLGKAVYNSVESNLLETVHSMPQSWVKGYLKVRFMVQWGFLGLGAVLAMVPKPVLAQIGPNGVPFPENTFGLDGISGDSTLETQAAVSSAVSSFDAIWDTYLSLESPYFAILLQATTYAVIVGFVLWAIAGVWRWSQTDFKKFPWQMFFGPILVVILFANGGQLTLLGLQAYRSLVYTANNQMLTQTYNGVSGRDLIKGANTRTGLQESYQEKLQACKGKDEESKTQCEAEAKAETEAKVNEMQSEGFTLNPIEVFTTVLLSAPQRFITGFLGFVAGVFHLVMAYALAVWASSAPLWISINLYPASKSGVQIFVSGLFAAMLSIWLYTVLQIGLASQQSGALGVHGFLFPLLGGLINPLIALFAGSLGFSAIFAASGVATGAVTKLIKK